MVQKDPGVDRRLRGTNSVQPFDDLQVVEVIFGRVVEQLDVDPFRRRVPLRQLRQDRFEVCRRRLQRTGQH